MTTRESRNFPPTKFSTHKFSVDYYACAAQPGEYGVNRTHMLKGSNSYRNVSLSLSTPHRVRRHRSLTSPKRKNERESTHVYEKVKVHMTSFTYRASGVTKFKTTKINSEDPRQLFTKICTPENYLLYGICTYVSSVQYIYCTIQYTQYLLTIETVVLDILYSYSTTLLLCADVHQNSIMCNCLFGLKLKIKVPTLV